MDFNLPEELQLLKETVRKFVDRELIPLERECRPEGEDMPEQYIKPLQEKAKAMGLWMLDVPAEYGGAGLGLLPRCIIHEEIARAASLPFRSLELFGPEVRPVLFHCNEEQKERFLKPVLRGELRFCFAQTEPDSGSDPANMRTRAVEDGDSFVINGTKRFITNACRADALCVLARTSAREVTSHSLFVVPMDDRRITVRPLISVGNRGTLGEVHLDGRPPSAFAQSDPSVLVQTGHPSPGDRAERRPLDHLDDALAGNPVDWSTWTADHASGWAQAAKERPCA